jgi:hypothetical protein
VEPQVLLPAKLRQHLQRIHGPGIGRAGISHDTNGAISIFPVFGYLLLQQLQIDREIVPNRDSV